MARTEPPRLQEKQEVELALVRRIQAGEKELFYELLRPHERAVYVTALSILRNPADAEDVAQDSVLKAFRYIRDFRGEARFSTWLVRITINEARMRVRRGRNHLFESIDAPRQEDHDASNHDYVPLHMADWREVPSDVLERKEVREEVAQALAQLPEKYREVLVLRDIEQFSIAETADALDLSLATVKVRLFRARLRMRDLLAPQLINQLKDRKKFCTGAKPWS